MKEPPRRLIRGGDELTVDWLNDVRDLAVKNTITDLGPGLSGYQGDAGIAIGVKLTAPNDSFLCVTDGAITAATVFSGSTATAGMGNVRECTINPSTGVITIGAGAFPVFNFSTTTGGIPNGVNVWVSEDVNGNFWITAVDCGN